jgi:hypothetical protein
VVNLFRRRHLCTFQFGGTINASILIATATGTSGMVDNVPIVLGAALRSILIQHLP